MRLSVLLSLIVFLTACSGGRRHRTHLEREEYNRAKLEMQNVKQMISSRQLPTIEFEFDSATLKEESYPTLNKIATILLNYKSLKLIIEGHCDDVGSDEYNDQLSLMRSEAVKHYLTRKGVYPDYMRTFGYGKRRRVTEDTSSQGRALNRRVEFILSPRRWESVY